MLDLFYFLKFCREVSNEKERAAATGVGARLAEKVDDGDCLSCLYEVTFNAYFDFLRPIYCCNQSMSISIEYWQYLY